MCISTVSAKEVRNMFQLDMSDRRPLYEQIKDRFKELIISGILKENDKIPSVRELAASLAINPNTIQKAYKDLENEGYIYSQPARGSFVAKHSDTERNTAGRETAMTNLDIVLKELRFLGAEPQEIKAHVDKIFD